LQQAVRTVVWTIHLLIWCNNSLYVLCSIKQGAARRLKKKINDVVSVPLHFHKHERKEGQLPASTSSWRVSQFTSCV
jgi:hypothetical protein